MFSFVASTSVSVVCRRTRSGARCGLVVLGVASILAGCSSRSTVPPAPNHVDGGGAATGDPTSSTGAGAGGGAGGSSVGSGPSWSCTGDAAYRATSTAFTSPTPVRLALALNELVFAYEARPISIVLHQDGYVRLGAASATTDEPGASVFAAPAPALAPVDETAEGFGNTAPQPGGELTLIQPQGRVAIALVEIRWRARPNDGCGSVWVSLDAVIPASEGSTVLHLSSGAKSIAELASTDGAPDGGVEGYPVHAWFLGESMSFDFTSLPVSP